MSAIEEKLAQMGETLPEPVTPLASYVGFVKTGNLVFVSGQVPFVDGKISEKHSGLLGKDASIEDAADAAKVCALNMLAQVKLACGGDLDRVEQVVRLGGFVASTPDFYDHPKVINGASDFIGEVFGDKGKHARAAVGMAALPLNCCVEVEGLFQVS